MTASHRLLPAVFLESFATILVERGVYFYTRAVLGYAHVSNLWIALGLGLAYVTGARLSHRVSRRCGEKRTLFGALAVLLATHGLMAMQPHGPVLISGILVAGLLGGIKWPVIESYVSAGRDPLGASHALGRFSMAWALAVPVSLAATGPLITWRPSYLFLAAAGGNLCSLLLLWPLTARPDHLPHDHPSRPEAGRLACYRRLLHSGRWSMLMAYTLMFLLSPLIPGVFEKLRIPVRVATGLAAVLDLSRLTAFFVLQRWARWHGRRLLLILVIPALPAGFLLALFGPNVTAVLLGEILFGLAAGTVYYASLYYAIVLENASVDAGGGHEGLIGAGLALGPVVGLAGLALAPVLGGFVPGLLVGMSAIVIVSLAGSARALARRSPPARMQNGPLPPGKRP